MKKLYTFLFLLPFIATSFGQIEGTWLMAPQAAALGVGPTLGDISWWSNSEDDLTTRACYFDDKYVFAPGGTFQNELQDDTWIEPWQTDPAGAERCDVPIAPHDGAVPATWTWDAGSSSVTVSGVGAYIGLPKVFNGGELTSPADPVPTSITYPVEFSDGDNTMTINIDIGGGFWRYILVRDGSSGIYDQSIKQISVHPNPASDVLNIENIENLVNLDIYSIRGKLMLQTNSIVGPVDISNFAAGMYTISAEDAEGQRYQSKFIVK